MREILFRGKRKDNGEWVYGNSVLFFKETTKIYGEIVQWREIEVIPETVGQYTGLTGKNGDKIFDGDIMQLCSGCCPCLVYWDGKGWAWKQDGKRREIDLTREKMDTIGNIYDSPELLGEQK